MMSQIKKCCWYLILCSGFFLWGNSQSFSASNEETVPWPEGLLTIGGLVDAVTQQFPVYIDTIKQQWIITESIENNKTHCRQLRMYHFQDPSLTVCAEAKETTSISTMNLLVLSSEGNQTQIRFQQSKGVGLVGFNISEILDLKFPRWDGQSFYLLQFPLVKLEINRTSDLTTARLELQYSQFDLARSIIQIDETNGGAKRLYRVFHMINDQIQLVLSLVAVANQNQGQWQFRYYHHQEEVALRTFQLQFDNWTRGGLREVSGFILRELVLRGWPSTLFESERSE